MKDLTKKLIAIFIGTIILIGIIIIVWLHQKKQLEEKRKSRDSRTAWFLNLYCPGIEGIQDFGATQSVDPR